MLLEQRYFAIDLFRENRRREGQSRKARADHSDSRRRCRGRRNSVRLDQRPGEVERADLLAQNGDPGIKGADDVERRRVVNGKRLKRRCGCGWRKRGRWCTH